MTSPAPGGPPALTGQGWGLGAWPGQPVPSGKWEPLLRVRWDRVAEQPGGRTLASACSDAGICGAPGHFPGSFQ